MTLPEDVAYGSSYPTLCLQKLATGELALLEQTAGLYVSADNGEGWTREETPWLRDLREAWIAHMSMAPDGSVALVYSPPADETEETVEEGWNPEYLYVDPDGNPTALKSPDGSNTVHQFWFDKDSRLYAYTMSGKIFEMDPAGGAARQILEAEGLSDYVCFTDQYMIDIGSRGLLFYDMENKMQADGDRVLQDFIMDNVGEEIGANSGSHTVVMAEGEEADVVYFAFSGGLYRHVMGGTAVEQVMEGSLSSLGDPKMSLAGMAVLPDNEFVILYTNGKMYRYVYNPDIPTIPEQQVSIYSLTENYAVRQAVSLFQKQHPEAYVRYEIGLNTGSGMTSEDAVKNLNTRIMSGSGPDLLVLDGLPRRSYEEKGVLMDLTEIAGGMSGEEALFPNLVEACREDGKLLLSAAPVPAAASGGRRKDHRRRCGSGRPGGCGGSAPGGISGGISDRPGGGGEASAHTGDHLCRFLDRCEDRSHRSGKAEGISHAGEADLRRGDGGNHRGRTDRIQGLV